jgi:hypothetical protein
MTIVISRRHGIGAAVLLATGCLTGVTVLAPAAGATTYYTRAASCAGVNFYPDNSDTSWGTTGSVRIRTGPGGNGKFRCNPALPNGAIVTKVQFTIWNQNIGGNFVSCGMERSGLIGTTSPTDWQTMTGQITVAPTISWATRAGSSDILFGTINNQDRAYSVYCELPTQNDMGIYGVDIIYKITAAKG